MFEKWMTIIHTHIKKNLLCANAITSVQTKAKWSRSALLITQHRLVYGRLQNLFGMGEGHLLLTMNQYSRRNSPNN